MAIDISSFAEKFIQRLASTLGDSSLCTLLENHLNRSVDSLEKMNPDSLNKHIEALSERSVTDMVQSFPSMLQERVESSRIRDEGKTDEDTSRRTASKYFDEKKQGEVRRIESPFNGSSASTLVSEDPDLQQSRRSFYSPVDKYMRNPDARDSFFSLKTSLPKPGLDTMPPLRDENAKKRREATAQADNNYAPLVTPATSHLEPQGGTFAGEIRGVRLASNNIIEALSQPTQPRGVTHESHTRIAPLEIRSSYISEKPPTFSGNAEFEHEEYSLASDSETSESDDEDELLNPVADDIELVYEEVTKSSEKSQEYIIKTIEDNGLSQFYDKEHPRVKIVAENAVARANEIATEYQLSHKTTLGMIRLALYNFVVLCDDSTSMRRENRISALKDTLQRVAKIATMLEETGISIRFLNYKQDSLLNDLRTPDSVIRKVQQVKFSGVTKLGHVIHEKIIQPLIIEKATRGAFDVPLVVVIITDGEPTDENREYLRDVIQECKHKLSKSNYGDGSVVFIISRVGSSLRALEFIAELENSPGIEQMVYCSTDRLDEQMAILQRAAGDTAYTKFLIELFVAALDNQAS